MEYLFNIPDSIKNDRGMTLDFKEGLLVYTQNKIYMALKSETIGEWLLIEASSPLIQKFINSFDKNIMFRVYQNKDFDAYLIGNNSYLYKDKENYVIEIERGSEREASFDFLFITNPFSKRSVYIAEKPDFEFSGRMVGQKLSTRSLKDSYANKGDGSFHLKNSDKSRVENYFTAATLQRHPLTEPDVRY
ncbi:hypothetical protein [Thermoanaerobacter uzonensis]|uniref:hypothetical protein n=1 Tax=Thermoanaerobacter uzonensis TaxID=447593 RepID=UPI003D7682B0